MGIVFDAVKTYVTAKKENDKTVLGMVKRRVETPVTIGKEIVTFAKEKPAAAIAIGLIAPAGGLAAATTVVNVKNNVADLKDIYGITITNNPAFKAVETLME